MIWAHTHGTICNQIPVLEFVENVGHLSNDGAVLWMCRVGHAYHWHCGQVHNTDEEDTEAVGRRKRLLSSEPSAREASFEEKRLKLTPSSFEMGQADSESSGSCERSQVITEQKADSAYARNNNPRGSQNTMKPITSFSAAEQHFSKSGSRVQSGKQDVKSESDEDLQIISDEEQCEADEDNQGDRISQGSVSESSVEEELSVLHCQKRALHQPPDPQSTAFVPTARPPLTRAYILPAPSDSEDPSRAILRLRPFTAAEPTAKTSRARSLPGSAATKVCVKPLPAPSTEARVQLESQPSVIFFEFQATADVQQRLQLSPAECGTAERRSSRDSAMGEDSETSGYGQTPRCSAFQSTESHPPAASNGGKAAWSSVPAGVWGCSINHFPKISKEGEFTSLPRSVLQHLSRSLGFGALVFLLKGTTKLPA